MLRGLHGRVRAVSDECPVHVHGSLLLTGNHLDNCIQNPGYRKTLRRLHAHVRAV